MEFWEYAKLRDKYHFYSENGFILFRDKLSAKKFIKDFLIARHPEHMFTVCSTSNMYEEPAYKVLMYSTYTMYDDFIKFMEGDLDDET